MAPAKATAAGGAGVGPSRRQWDKDEYAQRARQRQQEERQRMEENEERRQKGQKPIKRARYRQELPQPTQSMQARDVELGLSKNEGKTLMVDNASGDARHGPGFHCQLCRRTFKDSIAYLDHVNGRLHLRKLGQTTQVARSTLEEVRERLQYWRQQMQTRRPGAQEYDFEQRLAQLAEQQKREKEERRRRRKAFKVPDQGLAEGDSAEAMTMMGFGSFGSSKKR